MTGTAAELLETGRAGQVSVNTELGPLPQELPLNASCLSGLPWYTPEPLDPEYTAGPCVLLFPMKKRSHETFHQLESIL